MICKIRLGCVKRIDGFLRVGGKLLPDLLMNCGDLCPHRRGDAGRKGLRPQTLELCADGRAAGGDLRLGLGLNLSDLGVDLGADLGLQRVLVGRQIARIASAQRLNLARLRALHCRQLVAILLRGCRIQRKIVQFGPDREAGRRILLGKPEREIGLVLLILHLPALELLARLLL